MWHRSEQRPDRLRGAFAKEAQAGGRGEGQVCGGVDGDDGGRALKLGREGEATHQTLRAPRAANGGGEGA
eukprot:5708962-Prymnesium_polylepis.1